MCIEVSVQRQCRFFETQCISEVLAIMSLQILPLSAQRREFSGTHQLAAVVLSQTKNV